MTPDFGGQEWAPPSTRPSSVVGRIPPPSIDAAAGADAAGAVAAVDGSAGGGDSRAMSGPEKIVATPSVASRTIPAATTVEVLSVAFRLGDADIGRSIHTATAHTRRGA